MLKRASASINFGFAALKLKRPLRIGLARLSLLAVFVGLITGGGAVLFRALIGLIHNIAFLGVLSAQYDASVFTPPSPWGFFIISFPSWAACSSLS